MGLYRGKRRTEVPPHLFAISDGAYMSMLASKYIYFLILLIFFFVQAFNTCAMKDEKPNTVQPLLSRNRTIRMQFNLFNPEIGQL